MLKTSVLISAVLCTVFTAGRVTGAEEPVRSDTVYFLQPQRGELLDRDLIKIAVPGVIAGDSVDRVSFRALYSQYTSNKMDHAKVESDLGTDSVPPFEILWDCSRVPDQDMSNLRFLMDYVTVDGRHISVPPEEAVSCVLDRHPEPNPALWTVGRCTAPVLVDGNPDEWTGRDSIVFTNSDNRITAYAAWDDTALFIGVRVHDARRYPADSLFRDATVPTFYKDGIEVFFDPDHDRSVIRHGRHYQVMLSVDGEVVPVVNRPDADEKREPDPEEERRWRQRWLPRSAVRSDSTGYFFELMFRWDVLGVTPAPGKTIGFNLVNTDREEADGVVVTGSWAGISDLLHHNPSEWGTLRLEGGHHVLPYVAGVAVLLLLAGGAVFLKRKQHRADTPAEPLTTQELVIKTVCDYLRQNIGDEGLDLKSAAKYVDLSPDYLRQLFKKVNGENFSAYLNTVRLDKSRELLTQTNKRITEIAFESGFSTYQNFNRVFKEAEGMSPSEYRKKNYAR